MPIGSDQQSPLSARTNGVWVTSNGMPPRITVCECHDTVSYTVNRKPTEPRRLAKGRMSATTPLTLTAASCSPHGPLLHPSTSTPASSSLSQHLCVNICHSLNICLDPCHSLNISVSTSVTASASLSQHLCVDICHSLNISVSTSVAASTSLSQPQHCCLNISVLTSVTTSTSLSQRLSAPKPLSQPQCICHNLNVSHSLCHSLNICHSLSVSATISTFFHSLCHRLDVSVILRQWYLRSNTVSLMSTTDGEGVGRCPVRHALVDVSWQETPSADSGPAEVAVAVTASTDHDLCQLWSVRAPCHYATT